MESVFLRMDPNRLDHSFELFGLDFMIDQEFQVKLIEINTNPDITTSCPLLSKLITHLVENTLRLTVDTVFPPPLVYHAPFKKPFVPTNLLQDNKFHLILDETTDRERLLALSHNSAAEHLNSTYPCYTLRGGNLRNKGRGRGTARHLILYGRRCQFFPDIRVVVSFPG